MPSALFVVTAATHWTLADGTAAPHRLLGRGTRRAPPDLPRGRLRDHHCHTRRRCRHRRPGQPERCVHRRPGACRHLRRIPRSIDGLARGPRRARGHRPGRVRPGLLPRRPRPHGGPRLVTELRQDAHRGTGLRQAARVVLCRAGGPARRPPRGRRLAVRRLPHDGLHQCGGEPPAGLADKATWLLEDRLVRAWGRLSAADPVQRHIVVDRNLYTGQNPASSARSPGSSWTSE